MMKVNAVIVSGPQDFDFGTLGGKWRFVVKDVAGVIADSTIDSDTPDAMFQCVEGKYTLTAQRLDQNQAPLGPSDTGNFEITAPAKVSIDVVRGINISITAN